MVFRTVKTAKVSSRENLSAYGITLSVDGLIHVVLFRPSVTYLPVSHLQMIQQLPVSAATDIFSYGVVSHLK